MPTLIPQATRIAAAGNKPKCIDEFVGRVNSKHDQLSVARMSSPAGWVEPGQRPEFLEVSVVLSGRLHVEHESGTMNVAAGQAVVCAGRVGPLQHAGRRRVHGCLLAGVFTRHRSSRRGQVAAASSPSGRGFCDRFYLP